MNTKQMIMKCSIARTFTMAAVTALALAISPTAKADDNDKGCSNATLQGTFAYTSTGFITAPPAFAASTLSWTLHDVHDPQSPEPVTTRSHSR